MYCHRHMKNAAQRGPDRKSYRVVAHACVKAPMLEPVVAAPTSYLLQVTVHTIEVPVAPGHAPSAWPYPFSTLMFVKKHRFRRR